MTQKLLKPRSIRFCSFGDLGTGKTLSLIIELIRFISKYPDLPIWSNIELRTKHNKIDSAKVLFEIIEPCFVLLDELWYLADSRRSMTIINDVMSMLLLRSRRKGWVVGYSQQYFTQTDIRIRYITEVWIMPELHRETILQQDIFNKHGDFITTRFYDATKFYIEYDHEADPYNLNVEELKELYDRYKKRRGRI